MLSFLIAPDSFKGTLTAPEVCDIVARAVLAAVPGSAVAKLPAADGGEGFSLALQAACGGERKTVVVGGPHGERVEAGYTVLPGGAAAMDMASCAGLVLAGAGNNPALASTFGVGEMLLDAVNHGAKSVVLGLGGSATNDCGIGMAAALGYRFLGAAGRELPPVGASMSDVRRIVRPAEPFGASVQAACDVDNPLYGPEGAAFVFAPQKGADPATVRLLDEGLRNMAGIIKKDLGCDVAAVPGAGAAGGMGAGAVAFLGGTLRSGIDLLLDAAGFEKQLEKADVVITGEGRMDAQSVRGKVCAGVARRAAAAGKRVYAVCGSLGEGAQAMTGLGVRGMFAASEAGRPWEEIVRTCREDLYKAAFAAAREIADKTE